MDIPDDIAPASTPELGALRAEIDACDAEIVALLSRRARAVAQIGRIKHDTGLPIYDPRRESEIFANLGRFNPGPLEDGALRRIYERLLDESRRLERQGQPAKK